MPRRPHLAAARTCLAALALIGIIQATPASAQVPPSPAEIAAYQGLHAAAAAGDVEELRRLAGAGARLGAVDSHGRTALHVAAHAGQGAAVRALLAAGADANLLDSRRYDAITIAAVRGDAAMIRDLVAGGGNPGAITSSYDGTALIAAAHLGRVAVVAALIGAGAPLDHVNNLGWTALIEAIVLGDGGRDHAEVVRLLLAAGADPNLADAAGVRPLALARARGFTEIARQLEGAGARP